MPAFSPGKMRSLRRQRGAFARHLAHPCFGKTRHHHRAQSDMRHRHFALAMGQARLARVCAPAKRHDRGTQRDGLETHGRAGRGLRRVRTGRLGARPGPCRRMDAACRVYPRLCVRRLGCGGRCVGSPEVGTTRHPFSHAGGGRRCRADRRVARGSPAALPVFGLRCDGALRDGTDAPRDRRLAARCAEDRTGHRRRPRTRGARGRPAAGHDRARRGGWTNPGRPDHRKRTIRMR